MSKNENFDISYWGGDFNAYQDYSKPGRSLRRKILIVMGFIGIMAILPVFVFGLSTISFNEEKVISSMAQVKPTPTPAPQKKEPEQKTQAAGETVLNNDSYWKISKRHCGSGKYYLSIREQNDAKPLYKGDLVKVDCSL